MTAVHFLTLFVLNLSTINAVNHNAIPLLAYGMDGIALDMIRHRNCEGAW